MSASRTNWTEQEDEIIKDFVQAQGLKKWTKISKAIKAQLGIDGRTGKQCRERWQNHLDPNVNKEDWTVEEEQKIFSLQAQLGNKWSEIASFVPGRTENAVKNCFYSAIRRNLRKYNKNKVESQKLKGSVKSLLKKPALRAVLMGIQVEEKKETPKVVSKVQKIKSFADVKKSHEIVKPIFSPMPGLSFSFPTTPSTTQSIFSAKYGFFNSNGNDLEEFSGLLKNEVETQTDISLSEATTPKYFLPHFSPKNNFQHYLTPRNSNSK